MYSLCEATTADTSEIICGTAVVWHSASVVPSPVWNSASIVPSSVWHSTSVVPSSVNPPRTPRQPATTPPSSKPSREPNQPPPHRTTTLQSLSYQHHVARTWTRTPVPSDPSQEPTAMRPEAGGVFPVKVPSAGDASSELRGPSSYQIPVGEGHQSLSGSPRLRIAAQHHVHVPRVCQVIAHVYPLNVANNLANVVFRRAAGKYQGWKEGTSSCSRLAKANYPSP